MQDALHAIKEPTTEQIIRKCLCMAQISVKLGNKNDRILTFPPSASLTNEDSLNASQRPSWCSSQLRMGDISRIQMNIIVMREVIAIARETDCIGACKRTLLDFVQKNEHLQAMAGLSANQHIANPSQLVIHQAPYWPCKRTWYLPWPALVQEKLLCVNRKSLSDRLDSNLHKQKVAHR